MKEVVQFLFKLIYIKREGENPSLNINLSLIFIVTYFLVILMGATYPLVSHYGLQSNDDDDSRALVNLCLIVTSYFWISRYKKYFVKIDSSGTYYSLGRFNGLLKIVISIAILGFLILMMQWLR